MERKIIVCDVCKQEMYDDDDYCQISRKPNYKNVKLKSLYYGMEKETPGIRMPKTIDCCVDCLSAAVLSQLKLVPNERNKP